MADDDRTKVVSTPDDDATVVTPSEGAATPTVEVDPAAPGGSTSTPDDASEATRIVAAPPRDDADDATQLLPTPPRDRSAAADDASEATRIVATPGRDAAADDDATQVVGAPGRESPPAGTEGDDATQVIAPPRPDAPAPDARELDETQILPAPGRAGDPTGAEPAAAADAAPPPAKDPTPPAEDRPPIDEAPGAAGDAPIVIPTSIPPPEDEDATVVTPRTSGRPRLLVQEGSGTREVPLAKPQVTVGRSAGCDVVVANPEVSRTHVRIDDRAGERVLVVLGARRNTTLNGAPVDSDRVLRHGDLIELASERLLYADREETPSFAPPKRGPGALVAAGVGLALLVFGAGGVVLYQRLQAPPPPPPVAEAPRPPADARAPRDTAPALEPRDVAPAPPAAPAADEPAPPDAPDTDAAAASREEEIGRLLYEGDIAFLEDRLTTPPDGSAVYAYAEVLKLDPENARAKLQLAAIIERYLGWAERAAARGDARRARVFAKKAAYVHEQAPDVGDGDAIAARLAPFTEP